jgi:hypothetical protein
MHMVTSPPGEIASPAQVAGDQHDDEAGAELPPRQHLEIDQRLLARQFPRDEQQQGDRRDRREGHDEGRTEPIVELAAIENHFERAQKRRDQQKSDEIEIESRGPHLPPFGLPLR